MLISEVPTSALFFSFSVTSVAISSEEEPCPSSMMAYLLLLSLVMTGTSSELDIFDAIVVKFDGEYDRFRLLMALVMLCMAPASSSGSLN